jgi:plasmid stabilization system protein ParE
MSYSLQIEPEAEADIEAARRWYEAQRSGLGDEFLDCLRDTLRRILRNPRAYGVVHQDLRRALIRRFPYGVFYRLRGEEIAVVGVFHGSRDPQAWQSRS